MNQASTERSFFWKFFQGIARFLTTLLFNLKVYGKNYVPRHGGALIVSNHQGYLDPVILGVRLDRPLNYIAKSELFKRGWATWLLHLFNAFPVRQGAGDIGAIKETIHRLREGHLLNIYPEGSRTLNGSIGPLQKGVALIIRRARVPVVPAIVTGSFEAWPAHRKVFRPWPVRVQFGPPLELADLEAEQIVEKLDQTLREMFAELNKRPDWTQKSGRTDAEK